MSKQQRLIEYLPPAEADIDAYAEQVCQRIAQERGQSFAEDDIVQGLAAFMRIAARIQAKHLNNQHELIDNNADYGYFQNSDDADG